MDAFGQPGIPPTWTTSDKDAVGTALGASRLWYTVGHGILNEVYWPATGQPQLRDLGFIVAGPDFWVEVKRAARYHLVRERATDPFLRVVHEHDRFRLVLDVVPDPKRDALLLGYDLEGAESRLYVLVAPHLGGSGRDNTAWIEPNALLAEHGDDDLAQHGDEALALVGEFERASAGYVGFSDGWQDFAQHGQMTWTFERAANGNVALLGELARPRGVLALAFARTPTGAKTLARETVAEALDEHGEPDLGGPIRRLRSAWADFTRGLSGLGPNEELDRIAGVSCLVLKTHEDRTYPGAIVASLSVPWGNTRDDPGGYHLVWTRDAVETAFALLALGRAAEARTTLAYLAAIQDPDGHWSQNVFPDGRPFWTGIQLDETAFPILLAAKLEELGELDGLRPVARRLVQSAARYLATEGPISPQDRWEETAGIGPFTLALTVAALAAAALYGFLDEGEARVALSLADCWDARIEEWTYVTGTSLDETHDLPGHYVHICPPGDRGLRGRVEIKNREGVSRRADRLLSLDFLYLARLGLRKADDPRLIATVALVDRLLRVETPSGAFYRRYPDDGYGEHDDGSPFDGHGVGRPWPLLSGERGHYALLRGQDPLPYLQAMARSAGKGGLIPEQVWDGPPIPDRGLAPGRPTGSAMPLVWAHAEFLKLLVARRTGRPIEQLERVAARYLDGHRPIERHWRREVPLARLEPDETLLVEDRRPFRLHFGFDGWQEVRDLDSQPLAFGLHGVRLSLGRHERLDFTFFDPASGRWEGRDYQVRRGKEGRPRAPSPPPSG